MFLLINLICQSYHKTKNCSIFVDHRVFLILLLLSHNSYVDILCYTDILYYASLVASFVIEAVVTGMHGFSDFTC